MDYSKIQGPYRTHNWHPELWLPRNTELFSSASYFRFKHRPAGIVSGATMAISEPADKVMDKVVMVHGEAEESARYRPHPAVKRSCRPSCGTVANTQSCAVTTMPPSAVARDAIQPGKIETEARTRELGEQILA